MIFFNNYIPCNEDFLTKVFEHAQMRLESGNQSNTTDTDKKKEKETQSSWDDGLSTEEVCRHYGYSKPEGGVAQGFWKKKDVPEQIGELSDVLLEIMDFNRRCQVIFEYDPDFPRAYLRIVGTDSAPYSELSVCNKNKERRYTEKELVEKVADALLGVTDQAIKLAQKRMCWQQEMLENPTEAEEKYVGVLEDGSVCEFAFFIKAEKAKGNVEEILHEFAQYSRSAYISLGNKMVYGTDNQEEISKAMTGKQEENRMEE